MFQPQADPQAYQREFWPGVKFYNKQWEIIYSVEENDETVVVAGNQLGKDFVAAFIMLKMFLTNIECRIVNTSVSDKHLNVLWGEIDRFVQMCKYPLSHRLGGPLVLNHRFIRRWDAKENDLYPISYLQGLVSEKGEGMTGHHATKTMGVIDEASGSDPEVLNNMRTWASGPGKRILIFGNPMPCGPNHFFRKAFKEGDLVAT